VNDQVPQAFGEFSIGSQIAGYRLEEQIGRGGMAVVFRAHEARLDRNVALKILAPGLAADDAFRKRFIRESRIAAAVDHPNIIPVFDAGEADGVLFIAMRFVHGPDVRTLLDTEGALPAARAIDIVTQVGSALDAAHARGLVHRDVKPANMLLDTTAGGGRQDHVYLSDFGLGKQTLGELGQSGLTAQGQFLGTLDYMAPEQVEGRRVDGRADLYALACAAFELLCGTPPFRRDVGMAVVWAKLSEAPPLLSTRRTGLPGAVDDVLSRAMAKEPDARYRSCGEFAAALRDACELGPAAPRPSARPLRQPTEIAMPVRSPVGEPPPPAEPPPVADQLPVADQPPAAGRPPAGAHPATEVGEPAAASGTAGAPGDAGVARDAGAFRDVGAAGVVRDAEADTDPGAAGGLAGSGFGAGGSGAASPAGGFGAGGSARSEGPPTETARVRPTLPGGATSSGATEPEDPYGDLYRQPSASSRGSAAAPGGYGSAAPGGFGSVAPPGGYGAVAHPMPGRQWWRSRAFMSTAAAVVVVAVVAAAFTALHHGGTGSGGEGGTLTASVTPPPCTTAMGKAKHLSGVRSQNASVGGKPFGVAVTADGKYSFVSNGNDVVVLNNRGDSLAPEPVATIPAQGANKGEAITPDGQYLLVAVGSGAYVISVREAEAGDGGALLGTLTSPNGGGAAEISFSRDSSYAFVTLQDSAEVAVFNLRKSLTEGFGRSGLVGTVPVGQDPVGIARSADGNWLYVAQEGTQTPPAEGRLYVLSISRAETQPGKAVQTSAIAGCGPARVIVSGNGDEVWVTDRESNALVAFSAAKLLTKPEHSLIARVNVGQNPIGETFIRGGTQIMVADANLSNYPGDYTLTLVSTQGVLQGGSGGVLGVMPSSGQKPREFGLEPGGTLLVSDTGSGQLQVIDTGSLP
jgi:serine/threonine protein kinase/DNA-binding beta-propeller fold protein YncE